MTTTAVSLATTAATLDRARQSVFARNPGDRPETAANYAVPLPAYRMDRDSARVYAVVSCMQAPRSWDSKDERQSAQLFKKLIDRTGCRVTELSPLLI